MRNNGKSTGILLLCAAALFVLPAGCKQRKADKPQIALIMKSLANEFFKTMEDGAGAHHKEHAEQYDLTAVGIKDELDVAQQIRLVELMMAQGVGAIVIAPADLSSIDFVGGKASAAIMGLISSGAIEVKSLGEALERLQGTGG